MILLIVNNDNDYSVSNIFSNHSIKLGGSTACVVLDIDVDTHVQVNCRSTISGLSLYAYKNKRHANIYA